MPKARGAAPRTGGDVQFRNYTSPVGLYSSGIRLKYPAFSSATFMCLPQGSVSSLVSSDYVVYGWYFSTIASKLNSPRVMAIRQFLAILCSSVIDFSSL